MRALIYLIRIGRAAGLVAIIVMSLSVLLAGANVVRATNAESIQSSPELAASGSRVYLPLVSRSCLPAPPTLSVNPTSQSYNYTEVDFTFYGTGYTPNGAIERWFVDPEGATWNLVGINADSTGSFTRTLQLAFGWPVGVYTYYAKDSTCAQTATIKFSIASPTNGIASNNGSHPRTFTDK